MPKLPVVYSDEQLSGPPTSGIRPLTRLAYFYSRLPGPLQLFAFLLVLIPILSFGENTVFGIHGWILGDRRTGPATSLSHQPQPLVSTPTAPLPSSASTNLPSTPAEPFDPIYQSVHISAPGGSCAGSTVISFSNAAGPDVSTGVETLLEDPSKWDLTLDNCAVDEQTVKVSNSQLSEPLAGPIQDPTQCATDITRNPSNGSATLVRGSSYCLQTSGGVIVLLKVEDIRTVPQYIAMMSVSAWSPQQ